MMDENILTEQRREVVGEVYRDAWSDELRVSIDKKDYQMQVSEKDLEAILEYNGWDLQRKGGNSTPQDFIVNVYEEKICSTCKEKSLFDSEKKEFYCPKCD